MFFVWFSDSNCSSRTAGFRDTKTVSNYVAPKGLLSQSKSQPLSNLPAASPRGHRHEISLQGNQALSYDPKELKKLLKNKAFRKKFIKKYYMSNGHLRHAKHKGINTKTWVYVKSEDKDISEEGAVLHTVVAKILHLTFCFGWIVCSCVHQRELLLKTFLNKLQRISYHFIRIIIKRSQMEYKSRTSMHGSTSDKASGFFYQYVFILWFIEHLWNCAVLC